MNGDDLREMLDLLNRLGVVVQHLAHNSPQSLEAIEISCELKALNDRMQASPLEELTKLVGEPNVAPYPRDRR
jgi:hypothetical protein